MNLSPQHASYCADSTDSTGDRIKKSPRWDNDEGVASTIGTIMSLLVFLTAFGMFTNQFVPVWMSDNESSHMSTVIQQFTTLKSSVDIGISYNSNSRIAPTPVFVPITLSSAGIPVFAAPTAGILQYIPEAMNQRPMFNITYSYISSTGTPNTLSPSNDGHSGGSLDLYCPNRYFVEQHLVYESGAVILNQSDGEFIIAGPQFSVRNIGTASSPQIVVMLTQISLQGLNKIIGGTGSKGVTADLLYADTTAYENSAGSQVTINITSNHGYAWYQYFLSSLNGTADMTKDHGFTLMKILHSLPDKMNNYYTVTLKIDHVYILDYTHATVKLSVGELGI
jgi:hypothetical protein